MMRETIVDSHCHVARTWYEPLETLVAVMERNGVDKAVLIQHFGEFDNTYLLDCVRADPSRFAGVVLVDSATPAIDASLKALVRQGARGLRLRATDRSPGSDALAIWKAARDRGLVISCHGTSGDFASASFQRLVDRLPDGIIVLEHLASTSGPPRNPREARTRQMALDANGGRANVFLKVPGLGELAPRTEVASLGGAGPTADLITTAIQSFGPDRMMWGSDFPLVCGLEGYGNSRALLVDAVGRSTAGRQAIFGGSADRLFFETPRA